MKTLALVALLFLTATRTTMAIENVAPVRSEDPEMMAAIQKARDLFKKFLDAFISPAPKQSTFLVKIAFVKGSDVEHIWLADLELGGAKPTGVIANPPIREDLKFKQRVEIRFHLFERLDVCRRREADGWLHDTLAQESNVPRRKEEVRCRVTLPL